MHIELYKNPDCPVETPLINGVLQKDFSEFLVTRFYFPDRINPKSRKPNPKTIHGIANDVRMFLENLAHNNIHIQDVTYEDHIKPILEGLGTNWDGNGNDWKPDTYNIRYTRVRDYFTFLNTKGIATKAVFPAKYVTTRVTNSNDDFLSHTNKGKGQPTVVDDGHKATKSKKDYSEYVISMDTYKKLYNALKEIDPVFAVMADTMWLSMLRVHNVVQIPFRKSSLNKNWMLWPEFARADKEKLKFNCYSKGSKYIEVDFYPEVIKRIYNDYIEPYYRERKEKYENNYKKRSNACLSEYEVYLPEDILWLNKLGTPVKPGAVQKAFREASKKIGVKVTPHYMRHSGATHLLYDYCKENKIEPDERLAIVFHNVIKDILCHESVETTLMYIRTLINKKASLYIPHLQKNLRKEVSSKMDENIVDSIEATLNRFYENTGAAFDADRK